MAVTHIGDMAAPALPRLARLLRFALWLLLATALALGWLAMPYLLNGHRLLGDVGFSVQAERLGRSSAMARLLVRPADGPGEAEVDALYATAEYLDLVDPTNAARRYEPGRYLVFFVTETTHTEDLPAEPPRATLFVDGRALAPALVDGPTLQHHRTSVIRFPLADASGSPYIAAASRRLDLRLDSLWDDGLASSRTVSWDLPITYPPAAAPAGVWSAALVLSLSAGLLSAVLTPCLLQLVVVYLASLAGMGEAGPGRARIMGFAGSFVLGFIVPYTIAGAIIGHLGHQAQRLFAEVNRPAGILAGSIILALALWTAWRAEAPVFCRLPLPGFAARIDRLGMLRAGLTAAAFSLGCMTCFGGAIVGTLLVYVGTVGSASVGAAIMLAFSAGVAVPFLASAAVISHAARLGGGMARLRPWASLAGALIMAAFGLVLITDNFHLLSDAIYPYLHLPAWR